MPGAALSSVHPTCWILFGYHFAVLLWAAHPRCLAQRTLRSRLGWAGQGRAVEGVLENAKGSQLMPALPSTCHLIHSQQSRS